MMQEGRLKNRIVHSAKEPFVSSVWFLGIHIFAENFRNWKRKGKMLCWRILPRGKRGGGVNCARTVLKNQLVSSIWSKCMCLFSVSPSILKGSRKFLVLLLDYCIFLLLFRLDFFFGFVFIWVIGLPINCIILLAWLCIEHVALN